MKNMFGEEVIFKAKAKRTRNMVETSSYEISSVKYVSGDRRYSIKCPICKQNSVFISGAFRLFEVDSCSHYKEVIFVKDSDSIPSGAKFECERKDLPMKSAEIESRTVISFRCPYCNYEEVLGDDELMPGESMWTCGVCGENYLLN